MRCKAVLLSCLLLAFAFALPVQGQTSTPTPTATPTATPTTPPRMTNPTVMAPCGLPASWSEFDTSATFNMTADCVFSNSAVNNNNIFLNFRGGEFTINGNGYSIIGPTNARTIGVYQFTDTTILHLNNVTFRQGGFDNGANIIVYGGTLNGRNLIFRDNAGNLVLNAEQNGEAYLENAQFLNNRGTATAPKVIGAGTGGLISIINSVFRGNTNYQSIVYAIGGFIRLQGSHTLAGNSYTYSSPYQTLGDGTIDIIPPPKRKKADPTPLPPTSTPRPAYAASYIALQTETGMTFQTAYGLDSGVHFRQLDGAGIGVQSIIDAGYLAALDVYGYVEQGVEVCFPQAGRVIFLDARTIPRAITSLEASIVNGMTCVAIDSPGSLVLLPN